MPDSKITALASTGTGTDPANDPLVIVDVSDTSMAASGTTKKVTLNNLLACSPTATLASATVTGDLTVDTSTLKVDSANNRVGIGTTTPSDTLQVLGVAAANGFSVLNAASISGAGIWGQANTLAFNVNSTEGMRLNSTGLGVQVTPSAPLCVKTRNVDSVGLRVLQSTGGTAAIQFTDDPVTADWGSLVATSSNVILRSNSFLQFQTGGTTERMRIDTSGNVGVGVTPSAWGSAFKAVDFGTVGGMAATGVATRFAHNSYNNGTNFIYKASSVAACLYELNAGEHRWSVAPSGTAGNAITFTQAMTLDASGRLILLASTTTPATLATNGELTFTATSNTNLRFSYRGSDGTTRVANITLA